MSNFPSQVREDRAGWSPLEFLTYGVACLLGGGIALGVGIFGEIGAVTLVALAVTMAGSLLSGIGVVAKGVEVGLRFDRQQRRYSKAVDRLGMDN